MVGLVRHKCSNTTSCSCPDGKSLLSGGASGGTDLAGIATHPVLTAQAENTTTFRALCKDAATCAEITILCARIGN